MCLGLFPMLNHGETIRGPWLRPWTEISGNIISIPIFTLLQYREVFYTIFHPASGAPGSAPDRNFRFSELFLRFGGKHSTVQNFSFLGHLEVLGNFIPC